MHIRICAGGCNAVDGPKDQSRLGGMELFIAEALNMWEFIIVFLIALVVFIFFFVVMSFRKTSADSAYSTGHSCGSHHCQCTETRIKTDNRKEMIQPVIKSKEVH